MSGLAALDAKCSSRLGLITVSYYLWTTFLAVVVGIVMVLIIHPGGMAQKEDSEDSGKPIMSSADALLDLIRNMFPANLVQATFQQYRTNSVPIMKTPKSTVAASLTETTTRRALIYGIQDDNGTDIQNFQLDLTPPPDVVMRTLPGTSEGMNVLGIVIFSATMGIMLGRMGPNGSALILEMSDPSAMGKKLGFYAITVVMGLILHGLFILPSMYFFITKKNRRIIRFVLPVGATINMDGTALYEAVAAIFIAQVNNYELDFGQIITISITATAASIGAAGIPQAGLVTMVIVLTSVGLPTDDITLIIAVDWALSLLKCKFCNISPSSGVIKSKGSVPLICETKPTTNPALPNCQQNNGSFQPQPPGGKPEHIPPDVARLMQLEEGVRPPPPDRKKPPVPPRHLKHRDKDHCAIDMNGLETNTEIDQTKQIHLHGNGRQDVYYFHFVFL
ncbi:Excitatory amino acid transporter 5 [Labeo rohita]|uniref:Amino acid transporter n=1 Tax=Labeo rohita TaxID=84645 RepID=A0ABQ8LIF3_LABRO|nr:Excitatory amino acid transporter 5 [Labeo rohita]